MSDPMRYARRRRLLSDDQVVALYLELQDSDAVAARAGCSAPTVLAIVRAAGQPVRPPGPRPGRRAPLALPEDEIVRRYQAGQYAREIAEAAQCTESMVYRLLQKADVPRRRGGVFVRHPAKE
jgi:transposase